MTIPKIVGRMPSFDGVRGISVLVVVFSHMPLVDGGPIYNFFWNINRQLSLTYFFLDIFFVLSGFFITRMLLAERRVTGSISLTNFYKRRAVRIFPIYYISIVICYFIFHFNWNDTLSLLTYTFNFYHPFYPTPQPLEQSWSLSVEEQFYVIWPPLMLLIAPRLQGLVTMCIIPLIAIACGLLISVWIGTGDQELSGNLVYMSSLTRMLSLSLGGWLAVRELNGRPFCGWRCLALALAAVACLALDRFARNTGILVSQGLYWTIALIGYAALSVALIATVAFDTGRLAHWLRSALSLAPLRGVGRISYGLYLYHLPVLFYFGLNDAAFSGRSAPAGTLALASLEIIGIAILSYVLIERPLLSMRPRASMERPRDIGSTDNASLSLPNPAK